MIFFYRARLVILSQPKTGTTALEKALVGRADMAINRPPEMKHISYRGFMKTLMPWIENETGLKRNDYLVVSIMRQPLDWLGSWYRYRTRSELQDADNPRAANFTGGISFDQFVRDVCKPKNQQPNHARIKTPSWVALAHTDCIGVDRLFPYEDLTGLHELIEKRTNKPVETKQLNVSPKLDISLTDDTRVLVEEKFGFEFELHASLQKHGMIEERFRKWKDRSDEEDYSSGV